MSKKKVDLDDSYMFERLSYEEAKKHMRKTIKAVEEIDKKILKLSNENNSKKKK